MRPLLIVILLILAKGAISQSALAYLDQNNTKIAILNGGDFFWDLNDAEYNVPKVDPWEQAKSSIFSGGLWIGAEDDNGNIKLAAMTYRQRGKDFTPGPSSNSQQVTSDNYDEIFVVNSYEIETHISNPTNPIDVILNWPGNGDTSIGEPWMLAPFVDINNNTVYEPQLGDYPQIKGFQAAYCIYTDNTSHTESSGSPLNIDIHQMFYQEYYGESDGLLDETNLGYFKIINRSGENLRNIKFGFFIDFDLGDYEDDYVGCDTNLNMIYSYNADEEDFGLFGYGINPPAQGMMFLNQKMHVAYSYRNEASSVSGNPTKALDFYNYLSGLNKVGDPITYGSGTDNFTTRYMYHGDPESHMGFTEEATNQAPGDGRMLAVMEDFDLKPGQCNCIDVAFVFARAYAGRFSSLTELITKSDQVLDVYNDNDLGWQDFECTCESGSVSIAEISSNNHIKAYPNPSDGIIKVNGIDLDKAFVQIFDAKGLQINSALITENSIDLSSLPVGFYYIQVNKNFLKVMKK